MSLILTKNNIIEKWVILKEFTVRGNKNGKFLVNDVKRGGRNDINVSL